MKRPADRIESLVYKGKVSHSHESTLDLTEQSRLFVIHFLFLLRLIQAKLRVVKREEVLDKLVLLHIKLV
jgi:hypothetical protein